MDNGEVGHQRVQVVGVGAIFCCSIMSDFLPLQLIYKRKTERCHQKFCFPPEWHSPKQWSNEETMVQYLENTILPYIEHVRQELGNDNQAAVVILDNFKGQVTPLMASLLEDNNIHTCLLPPNTTDRLQPLDVAVNNPAKDF